MIEITFFAKIGIALAGRCPPNEGVVGDSSPGERLGDLGFVFDCPGSERVSGFVVRKEGGVFLGGGFFVFNIKVGQRIGLV